MAGNSFGNIFTLTTFGESHGPALGGIIDGCPAGLKINLKKVNDDLNRRRPGQSEIVTQRKEADSVEFLSGIFKDKTTGTPIGFIIKNRDHKSKDYKHIMNSYRPSHADFVYDKKYGFRDYRGGGRSSARETVVRVVAGSIAKQLISPVKINAFVSSVGDVKMDLDFSKINFNNTEKSIVRCPEPKLQKKWRI
jgi:chorismate synthase